MEDKEFENLVEHSLNDVPPEFREIMKNVDIIVEDLPTRHQMMKMRKKGVHGMLLGLYEGVPQTKRGRGYGIGGQLPDKITIFKLPILRISRTREDIKKQVRETVLHEIGHHFGMSEAEIHDAMKNKK